MRKILAGPRDRAALVAPAGPAVDPPAVDPCLLRTSEPMVGSPMPGSPARSVSSDASSDVSLGLSVDDSSASASPRASESPHASSVLQFPSDSEELKQASLHLLVPPVKLEEVIHQLTIPYLQAIKEAPSALHLKLSKPTQLQVVQTTQNPSTSH